MKRRNPLRVFWMVSVIAVTIGAVVMSSPPSVNAAISSIWSSSTVPATASTNDSASTEVGTKFRASVSGSVSGIRFYKGAGNVGTHTGTLWDANGKNLASVTFTNETATGWQTATFATPVPITANTTYVASYHAPVGNYSSDSAYFAAKSATNGPLSALQNGTDGSNGVYKYAAGVTYPTDSYNATNYWVDVLFSYNDTVKPTVTAVAPINTAKNVAVGSNLIANFSEALDPASAPGALTLKSSSGATVAATVTYNSANNSLTLDPTSNLAFNTSYTATVSTLLKDTSGNTLAAPYVWTFTTNDGTTPANDLVNGPGGPILVVFSPTNPYSKYSSEILRAEGINSFAAADVATLSPTLLSKYSVVVLGSVPVTAAQVTLLTDWVNAGGNLIALRPDKKLTTLLGVTDQAATLAEGYLKVNTSTQPGAGITPETIQFHGLADAYALNAGTSSLATLYTNATTATTYPAVTLRSIGTNGGQASAFTYDLGRSIALMHQGNPAWAGQDRDVDVQTAIGTRPNDLFYGAKPGNIQPDYVNLDKVAIPQADEQQRLLGNTIGYMNRDKTPLPKFWYFPNNKKAVVIMAGDDHNTPNGTQSTFDNLIAKSPAGCSLANWTCYRATSWLLSNVPITDAQARSYVAQGFDLGVHVDTGCSSWSPALLDSSLTEQMAAFATKYPSLPPQTGSRTHCIAWGDYASTPIIEKNHGIRMDLNYYYWPGGWVKNRPGFMTGSGMTMRFVDNNGAMIDTYQAPSHLVNESGQSFPGAINLQLDRALGSTGYYAALGTHYDYTDQFDRQLVDAAIAHAVPIVSAKQMMDWNDARNSSSFTTPTWSSNSLTFNATVGVGAGTMMRGMLPISSLKGNLTTLKKGPETISYTIEVIKGVEYAIFPVVSGAYSATYTADTVAPTIVSRTPASGATAVSPTSQVSIRFNEAIEPATITPQAVTLKKTSDGTTIGSSVTYDTTSRTATIRPTTALAANTQYTVTVSGGASGVKDLAGVALASSSSWNFTTGQTKISLWAPQPQTVQSATTDTTRVELGTQFVSSIAGKITGITYYKSINDAAQHTMTLWNKNNSAIASATSLNETASGWQTATFTTPISVVPGDRYTASYTAAAGQYSYTTGGLASSITTANLTAQANGGVYSYATGTAPTTSFNATNYWVDVIFTP